MVRMGDFKGSRDPGDVLVSIGLGSCIGLAVVDPCRGVAGLAHILLPDSRAARTAQAVGKFADTAVPALLELVETLGAVSSSLHAVLVGGAQMFSFSSEACPALDIGARNERATREALRRAGLPVHAAATGGCAGRTVRVSVASGLVTVKEAGGREEALSV
jgi:chemotaxis protein CheD